MAKRINREEIKAEVKRRQQNAARDYAEKANLIAAGYKTAKTNSASGSAGKKPIGASNSKSNVLSQIDEIRNDLGSRNKLSADALMANNPAYVYTKAYGDGKTGAAANRPVKGTATPRSRFEPAETGRPLGRASAQRAFTSTPTGNFKGEAILKSALSSSGAAYKKLGADVTSSTGNLSMGESARAAINEAKTAKKEGRQVRPGQAQCKAEQEKIKSFNDGWAGDFKQKLLESAEESSKRAYEYEQEAKQGLGKFGQGVVDFGIAGAQFAGDALLNAVAPGAGLAAMAGRAYGSASLDAQQRGLSEGEQQISGLKSAAIEVLTEKLFGSVSKVAYGKGIIRNESLVNGLVNRLAKTDKGRTALKVIVGANEEGLEEVLSDILNPIADRALKLDDGKGDWSDLGEDMDAEQMLEDYIIGSTLGLFGAGTNVISGQYRAENAQQRAYENYQRELVNAGLASEQGSQTQLTAEEYQNILDNSAKRGNRNLSDKETANLEQLITAERDTPVVRNALERSGTLVDDNTASVIAKAASGQKLTRAEQSIIDSSPVMQQAVNTMTGSGAVANIRTTAAKNSVVNSMAERYTVSPEVISRTYDLAPVESPEAFEMAFDAVYQMGQQGANKESLTKVPVLNRAQAEIAYNMGASTTQAAVDNAVVQGDNVSTQGNNQVSNAVNNTIQEVNNNGVRLRDSSQRLNGQNTEGQIPSVERGTVEAYTGTDSGRQSGYSAAQGKAGQKVVYNGVEQENVYYSGEDTESMKKGRELARSYGYNVTYFEGGNIKDSGGEFRGMVDTESKTVMVRSDHPDISAEQIMRHEMGHAAIAQGDISLDELRSAMLSDLSEKELNSAVEVYRHAYGDTISKAEAFEEMCCDALGKINIFAGTEHDSANYGKVQESFRKHTAETANKGRAPPKSGVNGKKRSSEPLKYDYSKPFAEQVDDWIAGKIPKYDTLVIGATPTAFRKVGFNSLPMTINQSHVDYAINGTKNSEHHIGEALLKQLPSALEQPVAIIASETQKGTSVIALLPFTKDGKTVVAPVYIDGFGIQNTVKIDSNAVTSIYGRKNAVSNLLTKALNDHKSTEPHVFYLDKAKATALYQGSKVTVPKMPNTSDGFVSSIRDVNSPVKLKIKDVTESRQFKRWFGNSKVVNADGSPKIVYHQTENDFTVFDTRREGAGTRDNGTPFGIFLKSSNRDIGLKGKKQMALYARIVNPLRARDRSELTRLMRNMSPEYDALITQHETLDREYKSKTQQAIKELKDFMINWRANNPGADSRSLYDVSEFNALFDAEDALTNEWTAKADELSTKAKNVMTNALESNGYDGVILENDAGSFGRSTDAYIALHPEQIKSATDNIGTFDESNPDIRYSLEPVKPIQPKNGEWERGSATDEVRAKHPDLWAVDAESSESRNPTQISGTVKSYRKIYDALKAEGFDGTVLDASSGLGYGTRAGIEEYGFNVEDIEPFPDSSYKPKYTDYSKLHKKYDVIISNAVLNVLPQDQRDALVVKMGQMLNDGGRMFINVRGTDVRNASSKVPIDEANMEYYISNTGSYQKGFTKKELVAYLSDALGKDYTVVGTNKFGAVSAVVTKQAEVSKKFSREPERLNELRRQNERKLAQATAEDAANENERGLIRDYQKQYSKVEGIREKLSAAQQTLTEAEDSGADYDTTTKAKNRFTVLSNQYAREHRKLESYAKMKALQNVLTRVDERVGNDLPEGMGAASANFTGEETVGERWVTEAQGEGDSVLHPISKEQEANLAEQQHRAPQEIPKEDLNGKLTSKHVSTIANSGMTPAEFSDALREDAALGKFSHIAYSDEEALKKAERTISDDGWDQALANYKAEINSGRVSKDNTVMGIALYNNAVNSGDYVTAMDIASLMVKNSTNTAQSLQAMRILNKLSPECRLYLAAKSIENIEEDLNERYKDNKADIHVDKILYDEYAKALRQGDEDGIKTAWANIEQSVARQIDATWYEKLNNFRYLAMLGNPRTHVRNIVGNAFFVPVRAVKNTIAYGLENIADAKINGGIERSKAILNSSNAADAALVKYAMSDYEAVQEVILSGGKYVDTFQGIDKHRTIYKTKILEAARKGNSAALDAEDAWFCKPAYANALAKWYKANGISAEQLNTGKVPEETIIKAQTIAIKEAQKATYRDTNWFSAQVSRLGKVDNKVAAVLIEGVLPFKKTPANILARAVEYSPVGLIKSLALDTKKVKAYVNGDIENGMSPAEFIDDISAGLTGSALMGLGILLASWGVLSGGDDDDEKQNYFDELSGKQNYALSIGGMSITLDWLAPESMPLFVGVELFNSLSSKNEDKGFLQNLMSSVMSLSTPMFEMSMLQSVNDLFDNLAYIKQGQGTFKIVSSMAANYISQYFPTLFGQAERSFEEAQRETTYIDRNSKVGSELQYMWGKIANKIPFYDFSQIPYIDAWGRTEETGNLFERMLNNFVNPAYVKKERPTEIDGELERLYDLGETSVYPSRAKTNTKINGEYLTADEYVKYATTKGQTSYELAQGVINSAAYSGAADPEKAYMLKYVYSYADHIAKYEVNNDYSLAKWEMAAYKSSNPAQNIIDHAQEYYKRKEDDES